MEYREYWSEIASIAECVTAEAKQYGEDIHDYLHQTLDSHEFVIYTRKAQQVIAWSPNDGAFEDLGIKCQDNPLFWSQVAYCAMEQDVMEHSAFGAEDCEGC